MPASTYLRNEYQKYGFSATAMGTRPTVWYVALHTADPGAAGTANEVAGSSYARTSMGTPTVSGSSVTNPGAVTFPTVTAAGYTVTHASIWDASAAGNCLFYGALSVAKALAVGDALVFATGELALNLI